MNHKKRIKKKMLKEHRDERYHNAIQKYIDGEVPVEYVEERWKKKKAVQ